MNRIDSSTEPTSSNPIRGVDESLKLTLIHPSIYPSIVYTRLFLIRVTGVCWSLSQLSLGERISCKSLIPNKNPFTLPKRVLLKMSESRRKGNRASQEEAAAHGNGAGGHSRQDRATDMAEDDEGAGPPGNNEEEDDPARRREIRSQYRDLINSVQQNREDMLNPANNKLFDVLEEANKLFANVRQAREAALDAQLLVLATDLGREKASQLHAEGSSFDPSTFTDHLLSFMGLNRLEEQEDGDDGLGGYLPPDAWQRLSKRAQYCFKTAPSFHYMFGSFLAEPPPPRQRIERQRKAPSKEAKRIMPIQLNKMEESHQEATGKEVERIFRCLQGLFADDPQSPILYYDFVVDPTSFSRTVENIFHTSFLIRDGVARINLNSNQLPCIAPVEEGELEPSGANARHQCVISISPARWREIIEAFDIKEALIPNPKVLSQDGS